MSLHDAYARLTPYEIAFGPLKRATEMESRIVEEAEARGVDVHDPLHFATLGSVAALGQQADGEADAATRAHEVSALAYQAVHFAREGHPLYLLDTECARALVASIPDGTPEPPRRAGYLQLPRHLFWLEGDEGGAPTSVDGVHWTATPSGALHAVLATGVLASHGTVGVVALPEAPVSDARIWLDATCREEGEDFAASLPGGEMDRLVGLRTAGEAFKLLARFFGHLTASPPGREPVAPSEGVRSPEPSALPYVPIRAPDES